MPWGWRLRTTTWPCSSVGGDCSLHEVERKIFEDLTLRDHYVVVSRIGVGSFGSVFEAVQSSTGQRVAIKVLRLPDEENAADRARHSERFRRETRVCAQLHHPNIVRLIDSGGIGEFLYAVFEFVPGSTLADVLAQEGGLDPTEAVHLMVQVLDALSCSHRLGIAHRDLKPANIMITSTGARRNAMVLDFGLGIYANEGGRGLDGRLTQEGEFLGTPLYCAPEQLRGNPPTVLSDLYAWGLTFLECLTGAPAMAAKTAAEIVHGHLSPRPVPLPAKLAAHPLGRVMRTAIAKQPPESRTSADQLLRELQGLAPGSLPTRTEMQSLLRGLGTLVAFGAPDGDGPMWKVPLPRHVNFTGRTPLLKTLHDKLSVDPPPGVVALHGLGGIGKTQTALEYVYRHAAEYDMVAWLRSEDADGLAWEYASLADLLGLPERNTPDRYPKVEAVRRWLERNRRWLVVFDNAPTPEAIRSYLPRSPTGHVITTSRHPGWRSLGASLAVDVLEPNEAAEFLAVRTGGQGAPEVFDLCEELGRLPLALEEAAAYIEATGRSVSTYRRLLETNRLRLLEEGTPPADYPWTVRSTWEISLQGLEAEAPTAAQLLCVCAYLGPDDIPLGDLRQAISRLGGGPLSPLRDDIEFDRCMVALRRYSLVKLNDGSLSLHRLVQLVTRDRLPEEHRALWAEMAVRLVEAVFPKSGLAGDAHPLAGRLLPHSLAALGHAQNLSSCDEVAARLLTRTGIYMSATGVHARALEHLTKALQIFERHPEFGDAERASLLTNVAVVCNARGDLYEARDLLQRALVIHEEIEGPNDLNVGLDLVTLCWVRHVLGDLQEARLAAERGIIILRSKLGGVHPILATLRAVLARVLWELGDIAGATRVVVEVLEMLDRADSRFHPMASGAWFHAGRLCFEMGAIERAQACAEQGASVSRPAYGPDHPLVLSNLILSGQILLQRDDLDGAARIFEQIVDGGRRTCARPHADLAPAHALLAETQRRAGDLALARRTIAQAQKTADDVAGDRTFCRASVQMVLGNILADQGDVVVACREQAKACNLLAGRLGVGHPSLLPFLNALARTQLRGGDDDEGGSLAQRVLSIAATAELEDHVEVAAALETLAEHSRRHGGAAQARDHLVQAQRIVHFRLGEQSIAARRLGDQIQRVTNA